MINKEWFGLILPAFFIGFFWIYFSLFPALYEEAAMPQRLRDFIDGLKEYDSTPSATIIPMTLCLPILFVGFLLGYFQRKSSDTAIKWMGHFAAIIGAAFYYGVFRLFV